LTLNLNPGTFPKPLETEIVAVIQEDRPLDAIPVVTYLMSHACGILGHIIRILPVLEEPVNAYGLVLRDPIFNPEKPADTVPVQILILATSPYLRV